MNTKLRIVFAGLLVLGLISIAAYLLRTTTPNFPDGARRDLDELISTGEFNPPYTIIRAQQAAKPAALVGLLSDRPDEAWCVVVNPPVSHKDTLLTTTYLNQNVTRFSLVRNGLLWTVTPIDGTTIDENTSSERWLRAGCSNWDR